MMDVKLPAISGADATKAICKEFPSAAIIMLSTYNGEENVSVVCLTLALALIRFFLPPGTN